MSNDQMWPEGGQAGGQTPSGGQQGQPGEQGASDQGVLASQPGQAEPEHSPQAPLWPSAGSHHGEHAGAPTGATGSVPGPGPAAYPQGQPGYPQGLPGYPQGQPGYPQGPYGAAQGHQPYGGHYGQPPTQPYGQAPYAAPGYVPYYGQAPGGPGGPYAGGPFYPNGGPGPTPGPRRRALRASAAALVLVAAVVAGGGLSQVIWPSGQTTTNSAANDPATTVPSFGTGGSGIFPGGIGGGTGTTPAEGSGGPSDVAKIASQVDPALVDINVVFNYEDAEGAGTGIVLTSNGEILTNNHVIDGATKISVTDVGNGKTYSAKVVGYDNTHDVAVVQLEGASGLKTASLSTSAPSVGEAVVAIGNAGGAGGTPTAAGGSVVDLDQSISASDALDGSSEQLAGLIEVNANVESGDSGGSLVNASGQVIGMDTAASEGFSFSSSGNQGFAIPISQALSIAKTIESGKGVSTVHVGATAFLGVEVETEPSGNGAGNQSGSATSGAVICDNEPDCIISGGPAAKAGLQQSDVITAINGKAVTSASSLTHDLVPYHPGQKVSVTYTTPTGQSQTASVTLGSGPPA